MAESGISDESHDSVITATDTLLISTTPRSSSSLFVKWQAFVVTLYIVYSTPETWLKNE